MSAALPVMVARQSERSTMMDVREEDVDIPEPEAALAPPTVDVAAFDPGADPPPPRSEESEVGDPAYDPGGMGRQPDVEEDEDRR
jgi:hypothetical protein